MSKIWSGITAGLLAGAAGATAKNATSYIDQAVLGSEPDTAPTSETVSDTGRSVAAVASQDAGSAPRSSALGPLGGLAIGVGVGAVSGAIRGANATPPPLVAALVTGAAAFAVGEGTAMATGNAQGARTTNGLIRDLVSHLAYGAVTGYALHRMLDPRTPVVARINPFGS